MKIKPCEDRGESEICWHKETGQIVKAIIACCEGFKMSPRSEVAKDGTYDCQPDGDFFIEKSQAKTLSSWLHFTLKILGLTMLFLVLPSVILMISKLNEMERNNSLEKEKVRTLRELYSTALKANSEKIKQATAPRKENVYSLA